MIRKKRSPRCWCLGALFVFFLAGFGISAVRDGDPRIWFLAVSVPLLILLGGTLFARLLSLDRSLTALSLSLLGLNILVMVPDHPDMAMTQALRCVGALFFLFAGSVVIRVFRSSVFSVLFAVGILLLLWILPLLAGSFPFRSSDLSVILLVIGFAALLDLHRPLVAVLLALTGEAVLLALHVPAAAVIWGISFLLLLWADSPSPFLLLSAASASALLFWAAVRWIPGLLPVDAVPVYRDFLPFSLLGPELPDPGLDSAMADAAMPLLICRRFGLIFSAAVMLLFPLFLIRSASLARSARHRFGSLSAMGCGMVLSLGGTASLIYMSGILPLPAVPFPFLTADFSSLAASLFAVGMLCGISAQNHADLEEETHLAMLAE